MMIMKKQIRDGVWFNNLHSPIICSNKSKSLSTKYVYLIFKIDLVKYPTSHLPPLSVLNSTSKYKYKSSDRIFDIFKHYSISWPLINPNTVHFIKIIQNFKNFAAKRLKVDRLLGLKRKSNWFHVNLFSKLGQK